MRGLALTFAAMVLIAGCSPVPVPSPVPMPPEPAPDTCGAAALQGLVGQPASVVMAMTFPEPMRLIQPGQPVTEDYSEKRLNIEIGQKDRIARIFCG